MRKKHKLSLAQREMMAGYIFLIPALLFFGSVMYWPIIKVVMLSFQRYDLITPTPSFIGLENFVWILNDRVSIRSLINTLYFSGFTVALTVLFSFIVAVLIDRMSSFVNFYKVVYFIPVVTSLAAASLIWRWICDYKYGLLNLLLSYIGISGQGWLTSGDLAMFCVIMMSIWKGIGFYMLIFLAGLKSIPKEMYEAARIDGASALHTIWSITLPLLRPIILVVTVTVVIFSLRVFTQIYIMTKGGPGNATRTIVYHLYEEGFLAFHLGRASALACLLFVIMLASTILQLKSRLGQM